MKYWILLLMAVVWGCKPIQRFESKTVAIPYDCFCGKGQADAALLYSALEREDRETVLGLIERGKVIRLAKGVQVHTVGSIDGYTMIGVETGRNAGERCWLPDRIVQ